MFSNYPGYPPFSGFPPIGGVLPAQAAQLPTNPDDAWQVYTTAAGKQYYYNMLTHENVWDKPQALKDKEGNQFNFLFFLNLL